MRTCSHWITPSKLNARGLRYCVTQNCSRLASKFLSIAFFVLERFINFTYYDFFLVENVAGVK